MNAVMAMEKWWLITWTTYGTWLPGDPRGFRTWRGREYVPPPKRYAVPGEPVYRPSDYAKKYRTAQENTGTPVSLTNEQRQIVVESLVDEIAEIDVIPAILSVGSTHVHWLAQFGSLAIRSTVGRIKSKATLSLNRVDFHGKRPWSKNCHMESKETDTDFHNAFRYVHDHISEGCLVFVWPNFVDVVSELLKP